MNVGRTLVRGAAVLSAALLSSSASGNGKFPAADQLIVDPGDPAHLALRTTFGLLTTENSGQDWDLICEGAAGYSNYEPGIAMADGGVIVAGLFQGVGVSTPDGCDWALAQGVSGAAVADVSVVPGEPTRVVALTTLAGLSRYYVSADGGATFSQQGVDLPQGFAGLTIDVVPGAQPARIYASGVDSTGPTPIGRFARSDDDGMTWQLFDIAGTDDVYAPFIAAVDPNDPDRVFVRLAGGPGRLLVTSDGGSQWTEVWQAPIGNLRGFALSPDGATVLVGTEFDGLHRASTADFAFEKLSSLAIRCLTWTPEGVYACVNQGLYGDPFTIGISADSGATFEPLMRLECVRGILACPAGTDVPAECTSEWVNLREQLDTDTCGVTPSGGAGGGMGGVGGAGGMGGNATGGADKDGGDCGCRTVGGATDMRFSLAFGLAALLAWRRRSG